MWKHEVPSVYSLTSAAGKTVDAVAQELMVSQDQNMNELKDIQQSIEALSVDLDDWT